MPERGWYSHTVSEETAKRVRELARARGLTVVTLINQRAQRLLQSCKS